MLGLIMITGMSKIFCKGYDIIFPYLGTCFQHAHLSFRIIKFLSVSTFDFGLD